MRRSVTPVAVCPVRVSAAFCSFCGNSASKVVRPLPSANQPSEDQSYRHSLPGEPRAARSLPIPHPPGQPLSLTHFSRPSTRPPRPPPLAPLHAWPSHVRIDVTAASIAGTSSTAGRNTPTAVGMPGSVVLTPITTPTIATSATGEA